jgi:hypothetical protein
MLELTPNSVNFFQDETLHRQAQRGTAVAAGLHAVYFIRNGQAEQGCSPEGKMSANGSFSSLLQPFYSNFNPSRFYQYLLRYS